MEPTASGTPDVTGLIDLAGRIARLAGGEPAPLERTPDSPHVWHTLQARRSRVDPETLAARLTEELRAPGIAAHAAPDGSGVRVSLAAGAVRRFLASVGSGSGMPSADLPAIAVPPAPGQDEGRFEAARRSGGAPALDPRASGRRVLDNPVFAVQFALGRARREASRHRPESALAMAEEITSPGVAELVTELLDAPRRLARAHTRPHDTASALLAVATAYLRCEPIDEVTAAATARVLERGMSLLGVSTPERM